MGVGVFEVRHPHSGCGIYTSGEKPKWALSSGSVLYSRGSNIRSGSHKSHRKTVNPKKS